MYLIPLWINCTCISGGLGTQQKPAGFGGTSGGLFGQSPSLGGGLFGQSTQSTTPGGVGLFSKPTASIGGTSSGLFGTQGMFVSFCEHLFERLTVTSFSFIINFGCCR